MRLALAAVTLLACSDDPSGGGPTPDAWCEIRYDIPQFTNRSLDLLFVIDRSPSMAEEQPHLAAAFRSWMQILGTFEGGIPDVHIGVISADPADDGRLQRGNCTQLAGRYITDLQQPDGSRVRNYHGELADVFACIASLGADGGVTSQPLEAIRRALDGRHPEHAGFLRDDVALVIAIVSDDDDCSAEVTQADLYSCATAGLTCDGDTLASTPATYASCEPRTDGGLTPVEDYVDFLRALKPRDPLQVTVSAALGPPSPVTVAEGPSLRPSCVSGVVEARPAVRLSHFLDAFPNRHLFASLCGDDLAYLLEPITESLAQVLGVPCLDGPIDLTDLQPEAPGLQIECAVTLRHDAEETVLEPCRLSADGRLDPTSPRPCWWTEADRANCASTETQLMLRIEHAVWPTSGTYVTARCATRC